MDILTNVQILICPIPFKGIANHHSDRIPFNQKQALFLDIKGLYHKSDHKVFMENE